MMCAWLILLCPSHSSRVLREVGLVGGNPTMNTTPGFVGGEDSFFFKFLFFVVVLL